MQQPWGDIKSTEIFHSGGFRRLLLLIYVWFSAIIPFEVVSLTSTVEFRYSRNAFHDQVALTNSCSVYILIGYVNFQRLLKPNFQFILTLQKQEKIDKSCIRSANEVDDDQVENYVGEDEVSKCPLRTDRVEMAFVLWINLKIEFKVIT